MKTINNKIFKEFFFVENLIQLDKEKNIIKKVC